MKRSTKIITTVVLTFGVVGGAIAYGKAKFSDPAARADHMASYVSDELELDESQDAALDALKEQVFSTHIQMKAEMPNVHDEVLALVSADNFDQAKALKLLSNKSSTINAHAPDVMAALGNFLDSLNAEQKAEILEFMDHKGKHRFGGHH